MHLFSRVEGSIQSVTEAKGEGMEASPPRAPTIFKLPARDGKTDFWFCKESFVLPANSILQVLMTFGHRIKIHERFN